MKLHLFKILLTTLMLILILSVSSCAGNNATDPLENTTETTEEALETTSGPERYPEGVYDEPEKGSYAEGEILIQSYHPIDEETMAALGFESVEELMGGYWYLVTLKNPDMTVPTVNLLRQMKKFNYVEFNYVTSIDD